VQQQAPERCGEEAAAQADDMGVEHLLCLSSWRALGELLAVVDETCMSCYAAARAAGKQSNTRTHAHTRTYAHTHTHTHKHTHTSYLLVLTRRACAATRPRAPQASSINCVPV
jgi:hypothetical protein